MLQQKPSLQSITSETISLTSANTTNDAHLDLSPEASGVEARMHSYFDIRVFYPNASSYLSLRLMSADKHHEDAKKWEYDHQVRDIEHRILTPLVFTSAGDMGHEATVFYRHLADLLDTHWEQDYSQTINWLRCHLSFALLCCAIMYIHGSRSSVHHPVFRPLDLSVFLPENWLIN